MSGDARVSQGFPKVPGEHEGFGALSRWMQGVRNALTELQGLSRFFGGLTQQQRTQLLAQLGKLATVTKQQAAQVASLDELRGMVSTAQGEIEALQLARDEDLQRIALLEQQVVTLGQQYNSLQQRVTDLENAA